MTHSAKHRARSFPSDDVLWARLRSVLAGADAPGEPRAIVARSANPRQGTFASEFVTVAFDGGLTLDLFCKHGDARADADSGFRGGLPGGLAYEAGVHRVALGRLVSPGPIARAVPSLNRFTAEFYLHWPDRAVAFSPAAGVVLDRDRVRDLYVARVDLLASEETLVHGDYYSDQVFWSEGRVHVVDWELAAIACGEVDLATVTLGRSPEVTAFMEDAYVGQRWPDRVDDGHAARLFLARVFLLLRLVGVAPDWPNPRRFRRRALLLQQMLEREEPQATPTS
jgi:hypothetical protein